MGIIFEEVVVESAVLGFTASSIEDYLIKEGIMD